MIYGCEVQGIKASGQLIQAILRANQDKRCDVLILARGGGSIEDLWAFNDEELAHQIRKSEIPIVSGIGHETDFTIADFVADKRAETPTAAAVAVTPDRAEIIQLLNTLQSLSEKAIKRFIAYQQLRLSHEEQKLISPKHLIKSHWQSLDYLKSHLDHALTQLLTQKKKVLQETITHLTALNPTLWVHLAKTEIQQLEHRLGFMMREKLTLLKEQFTKQLATLHAVSPQATLERGYAIVTLDNQLITDSHQVQSGDMIDIRLAAGRLTSKVL